MAIQESLEIVDIALVDRALRHQNAINAVYLVPGGDNQAAHKVQIEFFWRCELEKTEGLLGQPLHGCLHGAKVGLSHPQRPGQQQQVRVSGVRLRTATADRHLVPPRLYTRTMHAGVA